MEMKRERERPHGWRLGKKWNHRQGDQRELRQSLIGSGRERM